MPPIVVRYPLDPTGVSPDNRVVGEPHSLGARATRAFATTYGGFYANTLVLRERSTQRTLTKGIDYFLAELYEVPTMKYGKEVYSIVVVTNPAVLTDVECDYQAVGGPYSTSQQAIIQMINNLNLDDRPVTWKDILNKPDEFNPAHHLHDAGDIYGFEYVVNALERIRRAIILGDAASHDEIYAYIDAAINQLTIEIANIVSGSIGEHVNNLQNPHQTSAEQVGTYTKLVIDQKIAEAAASSQLGFTPVQQGGGARQGNNKLYMGWDGSRVAVQVDSSDLGSLVMIDEFNNAITSINTALNGKQPNGPYARTGVGDNVSFNNVTATGTIYCSNDIWAFYSDERLKQGIERIDNALEKICKIGGYTYEYNQFAQDHIGARPNRQMGVLAQEIQAIAPEIVGLAPFDRDENGNSISGENYLTVQYEKLTPLLIEAIRELKRELDSQKVSRG